VRASYDPVSADPAFLALLGPVFAEPTALITLLLFAQVQYQANMRASTQVQMLKSVLVVLTHGRMVNLSSFDFIVGNLQMPTTHAVRYLLHCFAIALL